MSSKESYPPVLDFISYKIQDPGPIHRQGVKLGTLERSSSLKTLV